MRKVDELFAGKKIMILGLGREGLSTYHFVRKYLPKEPLTLSDRKSIEELGEDFLNVSRNDKNITFLSGDKYLANLKDYRLVIKTPGVPSKLTEIKEAKKAGVNFTSQTQIFLENFRDKVIGITGTKGKSTTASLIHHILKKTGVKAELMGNIGKPVLDYFEEGENIDYFVFEMSSHQLSDVNISPHIAVFLNIFPEHLDYYEDFLDYFKSKLKIIKFQTEKDYFVFNEDINIIRDIVLKSKAQKYGFTANPKRSFTTLLHSSVVNKTIDAEAVLEGMKVKYSEKGLLKHTYDMKDLKLRGKHNLLNSMVAIIVSEICGCNYSVIKKCLGTFTAVEGRIETVGIIKGVEYVNDTLATIPEATIAAIDSFPKEKKITLILGGFDRGLDFDILGEDICKRKNID